MRKKVFMAGALSAFLLMGSTVLAVDVTGSNDYCLYIDRATETDVVIHKRGGHKDIKLVVANYDDNGRMTEVVTRNIPEDGELALGANKYTYEDLGIEGVDSNSKVMLWSGGENSMQPLRREVDAKRVENIQYSHVGIADAMYPIDGSKDYKVDIVTADGMFTYTVDYTDVSRLYESIYADPDVKRNIAIRTIEYNADDSGKIEFDFFGLTRNSVIGTHDSTYLESDIVRTIENAKVVYDVDKYCEDGTWTAFSADDLQDGWKYYIREYVTNSGEGTPLVTISAEKPVIVEQIKMAVFVSGDESEITAYVDNQLVTLPVNAEYNLATGDVFFYQKDEDGIVTTIESIFKESVPETYTELYNKAITNKLDMLNKETVDAFVSTVGGECDIVFGAIMDDGSGAVDVATKDTVTDLSCVGIYDNTEEYYTADNITVWVYDYDYTKVKNRVAYSSAAQLRANNFPKASYVNNDEEYINLTSDALLSANNANYGRVRFAVLKIVDDEITEALVIVPLNTKN